MTIETILAVVLIAIFAIYWYTRRKNEDLRYILTSQLLYLWIETKKPRYRLEYERRLKMCGLAPETIRKTMEFEKAIFQKFPRPEMLDPQFVARPLLTLGKPFLPNPVDHYKTNFEYPLSYVIRISDEADYHFWNSHERHLSKEVWTEIFCLSEKGGQRLFLPFATHLLQELGWTVKNVNTFSYNEQGMLDKYRWNKTMTGAAKNPWQG